MNVKKTTQNGKWVITWVPGRGGFNRGWLDDVAKGIRYVFRVVGDEVEYSRIAYPKNIPKYVSAEIMAQDSKTWTNGNTAGEA